MNDYLSSINKHEIQLLTQQVRDLMSRIYALERKIEQMDHFLNPLQAIHIGEDKYE